MALVTPSRPEARRWQLPLRWRLVLLVSGAITVLSLAAVITSFYAVQGSLMSELRASLREDVNRVAMLYGGGQPGSVNGDLSGPTGGVTVTIYDLSGRFLASSSSQPPLISPQEVSQAAAGPRDWQRRQDGLTQLAALAPFGVGIAAVSSDTRYIAGSLSQLARILAVTGLMLVLAGTLVAWVVAGSALAPLRNLARQAARLQPERLEPITYSGPADELGLLSDTLNRLIDRLRAAMDSQRQFLLETSHELRTPLTSLTGFLDRGLRRATPETEPELRAARRIASNMNRLVEDLLQLTRGQSVREVVQHLVDPFTEVLQAVATEYPGVRTIGEPGGLLLGDPGRLRQLIRNLTANAVRAAGEDNVELELVCEGGQAVLTVRDRGPGIPPEIQEQIFEKFYKGAGGGAGLGLAIAKQIAEQHDGTITLHSAPGLTEFRISLQLIDA